MSVHITLPEVGSDVGDCIGVINAVKNQMCAEYDFQVYEKLSGC